MSAMLESAKLFFDACETRRSWRLDASYEVEGLGGYGWRRVVECAGYNSDFWGLASATDCTSAKYKAPIGLFSKRHFSASCFSNVAS